MPIKQSDENLRFRKIVKINQGNLSKIAEQLGMSYSQVSAKLNNKHNVRWWRSTKKKLSKLKRAKWARDASRKARLRAIEPDLQYIIATRDIS